MIITLTLDKINIPKVDYYCTFSKEILDKLYSNSSSRRKAQYKFVLHNKEYILECPILKDNNGDNIVVWPAIKLPYRKYPAYVYFYAVALYLSTNLSMRAVAERVRNVFGLDKFSHSTVSRTLKRLSEVTCELVTLMENDISTYNDVLRNNNLIIRKRWDDLKKDKYLKLFTVLAPVLNKLSLENYASLLNYTYFKKFMKFII